MIISLPNGKSIEVSLEVYLRMTDDDFEYLMSMNYGEDFINPFESSVLIFGEAKSTEDYYDYFSTENEEEVTEDPTDLEKLQDLDAENFDE